jgi:hypothetical protein
MGFLKVLSYMKWIRQLPDKPKSLRPIKGKPLVKSVFFHENKKLPQKLPDS